jgi:hypothetical protein
MSKREQPETPIENSELKKQRIQRLTNERDIIPKKPTDDGTYFKIMSWNVAGLRSVVKKYKSKELYVYNCYNLHFIF